MGQKGYKRSWKNLLLDKNYQLVFTLVMVVSAALFMAGLGLLVAREAESATKTAKGDLAGNSMYLEQNVIEDTEARLQSRQRLINYVLIGSGLALCAGLFVFGIKTTHKVAGPMFKVGLYCEKMAKGKFDTVYNLRKGDQLVHFYDQFKAAHETMKKRQQQDVECLRAVVASAEKEDLASRSPDAAAKLDEIRALLKKKEVSLG
jgi:hypothetical protein